jgi:PPOX class probable F420-dependent enzyme
MVEMNKAAESTSSETLTILTRPAVRDFLAGARVGALATADAAGTPHNVPLCFWFDNSHYYFVIDEKPKRRRGFALKRMRNIAANPRVVLLVSHYEEDWNHLAYVLIRGIARVVDDAAEYMMALRNLRDKYPQYRRMTLEPEANPIVRVDTDWAHAWGARFVAES